MQEQRLTMWKRFKRWAFPPRIHAMVMERGTAARWWICPRCGGGFNPAGDGAPPPGWMCRVCKESRETEQLLQQREAQIAHVWERFADIDGERKRAAREAQVDAAMRDMSDKRSNGNDGIPPGWHAMIVGFKEELQARLAQAMDFDVYEAVRAWRRCAADNGETLSKAAVEAEAAANRTLQRTREAEAAVWKFEAARLQEILDMDKPAVQRAQTSIHDFMETALKMTHGGDG